MLDGDSTEFIDLKMEPVHTQNPKTGHDDMA